MQTDFDNMGISSTDYSDSTSYNNPIKYVDTEEKSINDIDPNEASPNSPIEENPIKNVDSIEANNQSKEQSRK